MGFKLYYIKTLVCISSICKILVLCNNYIANILKIFE